jgi:hypothetical protein
VPNRHPSPHPPYLPTHGTPSPRRFKVIFSQYIKNKLKSDSLEKMYENAHAKIRADPSYTATKKNVPAVRVIDRPENGGGRAGKGGGGGRAVACAQFVGQLASPGGCLRGVCDHAIVSSSPSPPQTQQHWNPVKITRSQRSNRTKMKVDAALKRINADSDEE